MPIVQDGMLFGDTAGVLGGRVQAGAQALDFSNPPEVPGAAFGDALELTDHASGGDDTVTSENAVTGIAYGDAQRISGHARGGNDVVTASGGAQGIAFGDADVISGHGAGGNDQVIADSGFDGAIGYGDARLLTDHARGGNDVMTGTASFYHGSVTLFGDADTMSGFARGGNDTLTAPSSNAFLYGDARILEGHAKGGDDILSGASAGSYFISNSLYGDGQQLLDYAQGGNDVLISDHAFTPDLMWGDAAVVGPHATTGADRFVIMPDSGHDQIMDFEPGKDHIDLSNFGFHGFEQVAGLLHATSGGVLISFDALSDVLVHGVSQLSAHDFLFA